ncbi:MULTISPECIES: phage holin family protein [unclassified Streptomyces]|uniref:Phage holin family protein n=1 Tax=Streptomyces millisiae TaxID=3075542 RepID=A0ABU2LK44_9ACTN|nr:phage holin family protein [Streptomyces sp. DSM 44918]MDT0317951.1 phage holin family protein [Streptomyces sp. DSM 44918]
MTAADEGRSLGELVASATAELSGLVHDEIALAKAELRQDVRRALLGSVAGMVGAVLTVFAVPLFSFALAFWIHNWWGISLALSCTIVGGFYVLLALLLFLLAKSRFGRIAPPERSIRSAKASASVLSSVRPRPRGVPADEAGSST